MNPERQQTVARPLSAGHAEGAFTGRRSLLSYGMSTQTPPGAVDQATKLTGAGPFVADIDRPDLLHLAFLRSPVAHGQLAPVYFSSALQTNGVIAALGEIAW